MGYTNVVMFKKWYRNAWIDNVPYRLNLKWWIDNKDYKLTKMTSRCIAFSGNLELLKWVRSNGCPWDDDTCFYAAYGGHLKVLKWARSNGCPCECGTLIETISI